ncbi:MAG: hypothetical protein JJV97_05820 [SAR324 cluster bacterium]|nr:hypothetical protein [SAR324 cluster bacterium]
MKSKESGTGGGTPISWNVVNMPVIGMSSISQITTDTDKKLIVLRRIVKF